MADNNEEIKAGDIVKLKTSNTAFVVEDVNKNKNLKLTTFSEEKFEQVTLDNIKPVMVRKLHPGVDLERLARIINIALTQSADDGKIILKIRDELAEFCNEVWS